MQTENAGMLLEDLSLERQETKEAKYRAKIEVYAPNLHLLDL